MRRENNKRRYPGETNQHRPDRAKQRQEEAIARQAKTDALSPKERLQNLDMKFGAGVGAQKERARLLVTQHSPAKQPVKAISLSVPTTATIETLDMQTLPDEVMQEIAALNEETGNKKKLKAKDRRARESKS